ncbi:hypothetical protein JXA32_13990 [Candidatus Sumerlaeota bacterium]|nr:hypothetical protein [Candidatus Sumerlaeota bacterium]
MIGRYIQRLFKYKKGGVSYRTMARALIMITMCTALAYGRVWLLFDMKDKRITAAQLQELSLKHEQTKQLLANELRELQRGDRLLAVARDELKMVSPAPTEIAKLIVSKEMQAKYDLASTRQVDAAGGKADPERGGLSVLVAALTSLDARR